MREIRNMIERQDRKLLTAVCALVLMALITLCGVTIAKYTAETDGGEGLYRAETFCFESDLLAEPGDTGAYPSYSLQEGRDSIRVVLKNYPDELRYADMNITYEVILEKEGEEADRKTGTLQALEDRGNETEVAFTNLEAGRYTVRAEALKPYRVTLKGDFTVTAEDAGLTWSVSDGKNSADLLVTVSTSAYGGEVELSWPEGVYPDNTDGLLESAAGNSCRVELASYGEYSFRFFKAEPQSVYTKESGFAVEKTE